MDVKLAYYGRSRIQNGRGLHKLVLEPNLARDPVAFDAPLRDPLRFREAISTLHDVVISDMRYKPRDKTAYEVWKKGEQQRLEMIRRESFKKVKEEILAKRADVPKDLEQQYNKSLKQYWQARQKYADYLLRHDEQLWRMLMPCDPVVTVGEEVVFFECFSADESSYGCLTVDRDGGFGASDGIQFGTTNVDYSWDLFNHFQSLRSYRQTVFRVDPEGFEVGNEGSEDYREEKIDLPPGWLRGFMQIQVAMGLPMRSVRLSREAVYSLLVWLKRHKAKKSPRALRFELLEDRSPRVVIEPWEQPILSHATKYKGPSGEPIRVWGRRRLLVLSRLLPLVDHVDVYLLGTGLPSFWVANMGEMRLTLGLSGWTSNDWTRGSSLDALAPPSQPSRDLISRVSNFVRSKQAAEFREVHTQCMADPAECFAALNHLALSGQVICDLDARRYRWRQVMSQALGEAEIGPENQELAASRILVIGKRVQIESQKEAGARNLYPATVDGNQVEVMVDSDGLIKRGECVCSHHFRYGIRMGPCRHLLALRQVILEGESDKDTSNANWYNRLVNWSSN